MFVVYSEAECFGQSLDRGVVPSQPRLQLVKAMLPWTEVHGFNMSSRPRLKVGAFADAAGAEGKGGVGFRRRGWGLRILI